MYKTSFAAAALAVFLTASTGFCGPFGLDMGMSLEQVTQISQAPPRDT